MRWILLLALLAGCATQRPEPEALPIWTGEGVEYELTRPEPAAVLTADLTLVELDEACAKSLLGIEDHTDIAPRSFKQPMGEIAAVNACYGNGTLLARPSIELAPEQPTEWEWKVRREYLQDWSFEGGQSPVFGAVEEGVRATLTAKRIEYGWALSLQNVSAQMSTPVTVFKTVVEGKAVAVQLPELSIVERPAAETVRPGETAVFQLSRAAHDDGTRIRLLFVRLREPD